SSVQNTKETQSIALEIYIANGTASGYVYNDDGKSYEYQNGEFAKTGLTATLQNGEVQVKATHSGKVNLQLEITTIQVFGEKTNKITRAGI
ncbi:alpha-glucosidase 2, partial [Listeria seeligeri FSL S4-171]